MTSLCHYYAFLYPSLSLCTPKDLAPLPCAPLKGTQIRCKYPQAGLAKRSVHLKFRTFRITHTDHKKVGSEPELWHKDLEEEFDRDVVLSSTASPWQEEQLRGRGREHEHQPSAAAWDSQFPNPHGIERGPWGPGDIKLSLVLGETWLQSRPSKGVYWRPRSSSWIHYTPLQLPWANYSCFLSSKTALTSLSYFAMMF